MKHKAILFTIMGILCLSISYAQEQEYYRLPKTIRARVYHLNITVNMVIDTFEGSLLFDFRVLTPTKTIEMHKSRKLKITDKISLTLLAQADKKIPITDYKDKDYKDYNNLLVIILEKELQPDLHYRLNIPKFEGVINANATGFYSYSYLNEAGRISKYAAALLKPTYARNVFPCLDEPSQKAKFKISIIRPNNYNAVSNGLKIRSTRVSRTMMRDDFEETPLMSTYLVSFVVSKLSFSNKVVNVHHALARLLAIRRKQTDYSIGAADKILKKFEEYVGFKYPLKHLYHVAAPMDFSSNMVLATWGLIVYKESFFLSIGPTTAEQEIINELIAHQIAHIYFENLVTFKWWHYNWLHEGLSEFLSYKLVNEIYPKWLSMTNFKLKVLDALYRDSYPYSESLESKQRTPIQVHDNMHAIMRPKGAAMMYMLEAIISPTSFKHGIKTFFKNNAYKNVEPADFYNDIDYVPSVRMLPNKIEIIMRTWNIQIGYPVIQVTRNYDNLNKNIVQIEQNPFVLTKHISKAHMPPIWYIPINYAIQSNPDFSDLEPKTWLFDRRTKIRIKELKDKNSWLLINKQGAYFYRVNYDKRNWIQIIRALKQNHTSIHVFHRMQLIDDCNALALAGIIKYELLLRMLLYLPKETEYGPFSVLKKISIHLSHRLSGTKGEKYIHKYIGKPVDTIYNKLKKSTNRDHVESMKLKLFFTWLCELNHTRCTSESQLYYGKFKSGRTIPSEIEEQVLCKAIQMGDKSSWNTMFKQVKSSKNDSFPRARFVALACTEDQESLEKYLNYAKTLNKDLLALAFISASDRGPTARMLFTSFFGVLITTIIPTGIGDKIMEVVISNIGSIIFSKSQFQEFKKIADQRPQYRYLFEPALEIAENNIKWREKHIAEIEKVFKESISPISSGSIYSLALLNVFVLVLYILFITNLN